MHALPLRHARRTLSAARDEYGVPHISAACWRDALYGLGYMHGLDRPTQMLFARAIALGRSAELIRDRAELAETDRFFRRAGLFLRVEEETRSLDPKVFGDVTAYCDGVNDGVHDAGRSLPMWATGFRPSPWDEQSVLLIGNLLSFGGLAVGQQQNERLILELIQLGVEDARLRELFSPLLDDADFNLLRQVKISSQLSDEALELITDLPRLAGSNAWAIAPARSATGSAILASDPHLEINRLPAIWYEAVLRWEDRYVLGATLPGCPLFAVARTERLAWGVTYMKGDTSDYFIEDCRPGGATGWQYRRGEEWRDFSLREESVGHKGHDAERLRVFSNPQGTLDIDPQPNEPGLYLSTAWTGDDPGAGRSMATWIDVIDCPNAACAMDVVRECAQPTLCWVFADREGHIGLQGCGWFPQRRAGTHGVLPLPAWDERNHWQGRLPTSLLPRVYDPPEGFIATANENVNRPGGPELVTLPIPGSSQAADRRAAVAIVEGHVDRHAVAAIRRDQRAGSPAAGDFSAASQWNAGQVAARQLELQLPRRQPRGDALRPPLSQRALGNLRRGAESPRRRHRLAADAVPLEPGRLLDDGAHRDRSTAGARDIALVAGSRQRGTDPQGR